ncbi:MAG: dockerin type I repeat-containing protein [Oscillospiraceae bacterium]|jgi:hypothetical protein|nr:dockerin type I repeat-containing protein [Oscillospiraceae bacterium]
MKKLVTLLTALTMLLSMSLSVNGADLENNDIATEPIAEENFEEYIIEISPFLYYKGVYYDSSSIDINRYYLNTKTGEIGHTCVSKYAIVQLDDGKDYIQQINPNFSPEEQFVYTPIEEVLATLPVIEFTIFDAVSVQKYINGNYAISLEAQPYLDHNADGNVNSVDLSLIKYELLH